MRARVAGEGRLPAGGHLLPTTGGDGSDVSDGILLPGGFRRRLRHAGVREVVPADAPPAPSSPRGLEVVQQPPDGHGDAERGVALPGGEGHEEEDEEGGRKQHRRAPERADGYAIRPVEVWPGHPQPYERRVLDQDYHAGHQIHHLQNLHEGKEPYAQGDGRANR
mmetsp:Transcript_41137/g.96515  ORF Transcript_41137/g.96515 Transcript_41137/m.96515 type:complete len:165 (-) Transcript_41137:161-655(-)